MIKLLAAVIGGALSIVVLIAPGYAPAWLIFLHWLLAVCQWTLVFWIISLIKASKND
jgi:hypothetical protein